MSHPPRLNSAFAAGGGAFEWDHPSKPISSAQAGSTANSAQAVDSPKIGGPAESSGGVDLVDDRYSNVVVLPLSIEIERERVPRCKAVRAVPAEFQVGDTVVASPVGVGTITSFTERGVPRVKQVAVAWLEREDGALYDPHQRRRR